MTVLSERYIRRGVSLRRRNGEVGIGSRPDISAGDRDRAYVRSLTAEYLRSTYPQIAEQFKSAKNGSIFKAFQQTELFSQSHAHALNRADRLESLERCKAWFAGYVYSNIAWLYLASHVPEGFTVLPEDYTLEVSKEIGGIETVANQVGGEMGDGHYIPDGIAINRDGNIVTAFEYTLSGDYHKFIQQAVGFKFFKEQLGRIANGANLVFMVPSSSREELDILKMRVRGELKYREAGHVGVEFDTLPFTGGEFGAFLRYFIKDYRQERGAPTIRERIAEKKSVIGLSLPEQARRQELARQVDRAFTGDEEAVVYVVKHGPKHEKPLGARNAGVITLPRRSPQTLGEPGLFRR